MKKVVVIEQKGFMTSKNPEDVLDSDDVYYEGDPQECNDFIHSKRKRNDEKFYNFNSVPTSTNN